MIHNSIATANFWKCKGKNHVIWNGIATFPKIKTEEKVTEWFDDYESFLEECESSLSYIEFLNESGDPAALNLKLRSIRQSITDTRNKISDLRNKMRDAAQDKEKPWKAQIVGLDIKKNELKMQVLSLDDISTRLKLQHVNDSVIKKFETFELLKESNKVPKFK